MFVRLWSFGNRLGPRLIGLLGCGISTAAWAESSAASKVTLACDRLSEGERAAIVARLEGEMLLNEVEGSLRLSCSENQGTAQLDGWGRAHHTERSIEPGMELGEMLHELGLEVIEQALAAWEFSETMVRAAEGETVAGKEIVGGNVASFPLDEADVASQPSPQRIPAENEPMDEIVEESSLVASATDASSASDQAPIKDPSPGSRPRRSLIQALEFSIGVRGAYQHWGREIPGALGPELGFGAQLGRFGAEFAWGTFFGASEFQGYGARDMRWALSAVAQPLPWLRFGVGPLVSWLRVLAPAAVEEASQDSVQAGAMAFAEGAVSFHRWSLSLRSGVSALAASRVVEQDDRILVTIPEVQPVLAVGARYDWDSVRTNEAR